MKEIIQLMKESPKVNFFICSLFVFLIFHIGGGMTLYFLTWGINLYSIVSTQNYYREKGSFYRLEIRFKEFIIEPWAPINPKGSSSIGGGESALEKNPPRTEAEVGVQDVVDVVPPPQADANSPLEQFEILPLISMKLGDLYFSFTNPSFFMLLTLSLVLLLFYFVTKK